MFECTSLESVLSRDDIKASESSARRLDTFGMLNYDQLEYVATIFAVAKFHGIDLEEAHIVEFGGLPHWITSNGGNVTGSASHFFSLSDISYKVYDIGYSHIDFQEHIRWHLSSMEEEVNSGMSQEELFDMAPVYKQYHGMDFDRLYHDVSDAAFESYSDAVQHIHDLIKKNQRPIIISSEVLNDPDLDRDKQFWKLPGFHIHRGFLHEICNEWDLYPDITEFPRESTWPEDNWQTAYEAALKKDPVTHNERFAGALEIGSNVHSLPPTHRISATYYWMSP